MLMIESKKKISCFCKIIFLLANASIKVVLKLLLITLNNVKVNFLELKIVGKTHTCMKTILITKIVKRVWKKELAVATLDLK